MLEKEGEEVVKGVINDGQGALKIAQDIWKGNERAALEEAAKLALAPQKRALEMSKRVFEEGKKVSESVAKIEQKWQHKVGRVLFPRGHCEEQRDNEYGACERAVEPANGYCDSKCAECDRGIAECFNECASKCGQCPDADQTGCHNDCNNRCDQCQDNGCRGAICNSRWLKGCHDGCNGRANAGAGCRGAWCGNGQYVRGCRDGCSGRNNEAAKCRGAWCGQGEAVVGCHQEQNLKRDACKREAEARYKNCH